VVRLEKPEQFQGDLPIDSVLYRNAGAAAAMTQLLIAARPPADHHDPRRIRPGRDRRPAPAWAMHGGCATPA